MNVLDLFAGIGGFSLGLDKTGGFKTVGFVEWNTDAQIVLRKHCSPLITEVIGNAILGDML
jgi:DNA (cytosine-5)-methyltransferase 1